MTTKELLIVILRLTGERTVNWEEMYTQLVSLCRAEKIAGRERTVDFGSAKHLARTRRKSQYLYKRERTKIDWLLQLANECR